MSWKVKIVCVVLFSALFVEMEADFHARVPVVICKERSRSVSFAVTWVFLACDKRILTVLIPQEHKTPN